MSTLDAPDPTDDSDGRRAVVLRKAHRPASLLALLCALFLALTFAGIGPAPVAHADSGTQACSAQQQELDSVNAEIARHNAQPHVFIIPQQQAAANAYDAEAAQLNARAAQAKSNVSGCTRVTDALANGGSIPTPSRSTVDKIDAAKNRLPSGYKAPAPPPVNPKSNNTVVAPELRPVFEALRENSPPRSLGNAPLQGQPKPAVGDPDPFKPGSTIQGAWDDPSRPDVTADHIVPLAALVYLPGFLQLPPEYMYMVANAPLNLQWLSRAANSAKGSKSVAAMTNVDPQWQSEQATLQQGTMDKLQELINQLLSTLPPSS